jgi:Ca2+-binding RTX toxin-like protein
VDAFLSASGATTALDASTKIVYDSANGNLYYDADGVGGIAAVHFVTLAGAPTLSAADVEVI